MANTTFTGNVRENGDGLRDSVAGSMAATANFHIANTLTAGDGSVQKSETDTKSFPTEIVDLPSRGKFYAEGHPLSTGKVVLTKTLELATEPSFRVMVNVMSLPSSTALGESMV